MKHTIRHKDGGLIEADITRGSAIKLMCTECMGFGEGHPRNCTDIHCPLYPFRGKKNTTTGNRNALPEPEPEQPVAA